MKNNIIIIIVTILAAACRDINTIVSVNNFQEELDSFLVSSDGSGVDNNYCIILFNDMPDSTVTFIKSKTFHELVYEHHRTKTKLYAKNGDTLIVCSPINYRFEPLFSNWESISRQRFPDNGPHFYKRVDYVIRGGILRKLSDKTDTIKEPCLQVFKSRVSNSYLLFNGSIPGYAEYFDDSCVWIGEYTKVDSIITFVPHHVVQKGSLTPCLAPIEKQVVFNDTINLLIHRTGLLMLEDSIIFPPEKDTLFFDKVLSF